jgi:hypothetical protein
MMGEVDAKPHALCRHLVHIDQRHPGSLVPILLDADPQRTGTLKIFLQERGICWKHIFSLNDFTS